MGRILYSPKHTHLLLWLGLTFIYIVLRINTLAIPLDRDEGAFGLIGLRISFMPASSGVRDPFLVLQGMQLHTRLVHDVCPPCERGRTWSRLRLWAGSFCPQY